MIRTLIDLIIKLEIGWGYCQVCWGNYNEQVKNEEHNKEMRNMMSKKFVW